jgi:hypothetical protein
MNDVQGQIVGCLLKLDNNLDSVWYRKYYYYHNPPQYDHNFYGAHYICDSKVTHDGGIVCAGYIDQGISDPSPFLQTPWVFKVDSMGCLEAGCQFVHIDEVVIGLENSLSIYPNPCSVTCTVAINLSDTDRFNDQFQHTQLITTDENGREVRVDPINFVQSGQKIEMEVSSLSPGIYTTHWVCNGTWLDSVQWVKQ